MNLSGRRDESQSLNKLTHREEAVSEIDYFLVRNGGGITHNLIDGTLRLQGLTPKKNKNELEATIATAEPGVSCWEHNVCAGGKWYYILEGTLEVLANDVSYILDEGDSIYIESTTSHIWRNPGTKMAKALILSSSPSLSPGVRADEAEPCK